MIFGFVSVEFCLGLGKEEIWGRGFFCLMMIVIGFVFVCGSCNMWVLSEGWFWLFLIVKFVLLFLRIEMMCWRVINLVFIVFLSNV